MSPHDYLQHYNNYVIKGYTSLEIRIVCRSLNYGTSETWTKDMVCTKIITIKIINKMFPKVIL